MAQSIIIIGAGIGGLATGCYAQMNGYQTEIFEMHDKPGGYCTAWKRKGYTFDYCIHNLSGTGPRARLRKLWEELGTFEGMSIIDHECFVRVESLDGRQLCFYTDLNKLERHMKDIAPQDSRQIEEYVRTIRKFTKIDLFSALQGGFLNRLRLLTFLPTLAKWTKVSMAEYAERFSHPFLRKAFSTAQYDISNVPVVINFVFMSGLSNGDLGWPKGGSLAFSENIEKRYLDLGGQIHYRSKVSKIIVKDGRAVGIRLEDGTEHFADRIISNADGYSTIYRMLDGRYTNELIDSYYEKWWPKTQEFGAQVALGVNRDLSGEPHSIVLFLDEPITIEGVERDRVDLELFDDATGMVPPGKGVIKVIINSSHQYWEERKKDGSYEREKNKLADSLIFRLEKRFPGLCKQVEVVDVSTPLTAERFTGSFHGLQAWGAKERQSAVAKKGLSVTLPGLNNFYMVGQWAAASIGVFTVAVQGRNLVKRICREDGKTFQVRQQPVTSASVTDRQE